MSIYDAHRIYKPPWWKVGPLRKGRNKRTPYVIGFDSEAEKGKPFLFQWSLPDGTRDDVILQDIPDEKHAGIRHFVEFLYKHCTRRDVDYIVFGFNLNYEYTQLFRDIDDDAKNAPELVIDLQLHDENESRISAMNDKRYTMQLTLGRSKIRVKVIDAMAYFVMSLDAASKIIEVGAKLPKPKQFAKRYRHTPAFIAYAKQDAYLTRKLGEYVIALHERYDVNTCMSAPHFASSTFRRHYLQSDLEPLDSDFEQFGLDSYHGGHNGYYLSDPVRFPVIWQYDIRSAYPEAMRQLPNLEDYEIEYLEEYEQGAHAIWEIEYRYTGCHYKPLSNHDGSPVQPGTHLTRLTSYEIDEAIRQGEIELISCKGFAMRGKPGGPLADYVDEFYKLKSTTKNKAEKQTAKLFLNSLYGKFFQKVPRGLVGTWDLETGEYMVSDPSVEYDYDAGGLYHPPIASLITGFVRAKIHRLEHKYDAIMTSTDGFFAHNPPDASDIGDALGQLDAKQGELRIWRERLYVFDPNDGTERKYALHGFRGKVAELLRMPISKGIFSYTAQAMISLKMSTRSFRGVRYQAGEFTSMEFVLDLTRAKASVAEIRPP